jgi:hypothetical protein
MERQLVLLEQEPDWRLDAQTREVGRAGLAMARAALRAAAERAADHPPAASAGRSAA